jgi:hypothetical protein
VYITLWGDYIEQFGQFQNTNINEKDVVLILQFGRVKFFRGDALQLS